MRDVAKLAGVSKQTVSVVLNGKPGITAETQQRVLEAVDKLGYRVSTVARSLRTGRTRTIAFIASDTSSPFIGRLAVAAEDYANSSGYSLILHNTHDDVDRENAYFAACIARGVDGVVFISATDECPGLDILRKAGVPAVAIDRLPEPYDGPSVTLNDIETGRLAGEHLLRLGHTRLAHISGPLTLRMGRSRLQGFRETLEAHGAAAGLHVETAGGWGYQPGHEAMVRVLHAGRKPTALFAAADTLAIGAMHAIRQAGLRVPEDISVIGVDDIDCAAFQNPPLTTLRQSKKELAELGLQLLFDILDGKEPERTEIVMEPLLIVRRSTAPLRQD